MNYHVTALKNDNETQWQNFFESHRGVIYCICLRYVKNHDDALDLTQQAFIKFFENYHHIRSSPAAYLKAIARNLSINFLKSQNSVDITDTMDSLQSIDTIGFASSQCLSGAAQCALQQLDEYCRAFIYYLSEGFKIREIAQIFSADEGKVRSDSARCRRKAIYALYGTMDSHAQFSEQERCFIEYYFKHAYWPREKVKEKMELSEKDFVTLLREVLRKLEVYAA